jgi:xanthine dehydrogenase accessory factor
LQYLPLRDWTGVALRQLLHETAVARILVANVRGSAPREAGACMLVTQTAQHGTIGGGQLEWQALRAARELLADDAPGARLQRMVLGADIGQCCGGVVELWIECYRRSDADLLTQARGAAGRGPTVVSSILCEGRLMRRVVSERDGGLEGEQLRRLPRAQAPPRLRRADAGTLELLERWDHELRPLWLYGAGNVGQALAPILTQLPFQVTWVDARPGVFPPSMADTLRMYPSSDPVATVGEAPPGSHFVIMTHSHALDYSLCRAILHRGDFAWAGLIGSRSKAARFRARLARHGLADECIARLVCPIGLHGIHSKWPAAIAVAVAAQLLQWISGDDGAGHAPIACESGDCERCANTAGARMT